MPRTQPKSLGVNLSSPLDVAIRESGLTASALADAVGTDKTRISIWRNGRESIPKKWIAPLAAQLGVEPEALRPMQTGVAKVYGDLGNERARKAWGHYLQKRYGLSLNGWETLYRMQDGRCALCNEAITLQGERKARTDHSHQEPYYVRGLLCGGCNTWLREWEHDPDPKQMRALGYHDAAHYLETNGHAILPGTM